MKVLLDTCTFLWIVSGDSALSPTAATLFADPGNEVFLSAVSAWEIAVKSALGKLPLPKPPAAFVPEQRDLHAIAALPLDEGAALAVGRLPDIHRDPFDRMLVAQAIVAGMTILTPDPEITRYPAPTIW
jgi:PIN domain nuclease of toxin-antitoxin system